MRSIQIFILFCLVSSIARAQIVFTNTNHVHTIGKNIQYFIDSSNNKNIQDIVTKPQIFSSFNKDVPNLGLLQSPIWLKITIVNKSNVENLTLELAQPLLNEVVFYNLINDRYVKNTSGLNHNFYSRLLSNHNFSYDINVPINSTKAFYFKILSSQNMELPVFLGTKDNVNAYNSNKNIIYGIFFGIIITMFFYNLFIYSTVKDKIYLYYVLYILVVGLAQATIDGYSFQFLWPNSSFLATGSFYFLTALVNITGVEFMRKYLNTKINLPKIDKISYIIYAVYCSVIILVICKNYHFSYQILQSFAGLVSLYMLVVTILLIRKKNRAAKFFFIAWTPLIIGIIIYVLKDVGVVSYSILTNYSIAIGSALEVILLSFALADKINILQAQTLASNAAALKAARDSEQFMIAQNALLDGLVKERTIELEKTNIELENSFKNLQDKESQLVESEKMASLGQLTAGIAHEINNPINFVTSNVKPLKRDVDILVDLVAQVENIGVSENSAEDKRKQIEGLKSDLDYDYLRNEIDYLLNGISDGASRTAEIVKGLRVFSRLDEDDLKNADINEGLSSTLVIVNHMLNNIITVDKQYSGIPLIECYPGKLNQVFLNIMGNAIYAIHKQWEGQPGGKLTLKTTNDESYVTISIADNGIGMDEATRKKLFEPFFTTKDVGEGTGLGLSIAYNTILKHNGTIDVVSVKGVGTEFIIKLPINQSNSING